MEKSIHRQKRVLDAGFTLVELMVTLAIAAVLAMLAAPNIRDFIVRSKMTNLSNEFTSSILKARNEAVNRNTCVTMCMSTSAGNELSSIGSGGPKCTTAGADWQVGWIVFLNPSCDSGADKPADVIDMLLARPRSGADYLLQAQASSPTKKMMFNARGAPGLGAADQFNFIYREESDPLNKYSVNVCIDALGRTRTIPADKTCAGYK